MPDAPFPIFFTDPWLCFFTMLGVAILWAKEHSASLSPGKASATLRIYGMSGAVEFFCPPSSKKGEIIQFLLFIVLGTLVGVAIGQPTIPAQALAAGVGWTALLSQRVPGQEHAKLPPSTGR